MTEHLTTDLNVATAVQEADEAAGLAAALEERVRNGDDTVTPEQIASARELGRFAQLRADATRRKADAAKRDARLADLAQLKADIDDHQDDNDDTAAELLDTAYKALVAYVQHVHTHNTQVSDWRTRLTALNVPEHLSPFTPPAEHGHLGRRGHDVIAGNTVYTQVSPWPAIDALDAAIRHHHNNANQGHLDAAAKKITQAKSITRGIKARPHAREDLVHYRTPGGVVFAYDPDKAPTSEDITRLGLTHVTQEEAYSA